MSYVGAPGCVADMEDTLSLINTDKKDTQHDPGHFDIALELARYVAD